MRLKHSKEWFEKNAKMEGDLEVGIGWHPVEKSGLLSVWGRIVSFFRTLLTK